MQGRGRRKAEYRAAEKEEDDWVSDQSMGEEAGSNDATDKNGVAPALVVEGRNLTGGEDAELLTEKTPNPSDEEIS